MSEDRRVTNLRHECERDGCYRAELWDWTPFNNCFGDSGIRISDIDGIVERNGLFLMLDGKRVGKAGQRNISNGHRRLYSQFAKKGGHVLVFHGQPPTTVLWLRQWLPGGDFVEEQPCDLDDLRAVVAGWYVWANGMRPHPTGLMVVDNPVSAPHNNDGEWDDVVTRKPGSGLPPEWQVP